MGLMEAKVPAGQKSNWENRLIPHYMKRLKMYVGGELEDTEKRNFQYANLLINNKIFFELARLVHPNGRHKCPFPPDIALALDWTLHAADQVPGNKEKIKSFPYLYRNFEKIMKKETLK